MQEKWKVLSYEMKDWHSSWLGLIPLKVTE